MNRLKNSLLILSSGGMTLCCFYACSSFIFAAIAQKPIPLPQAAAILYLATAITCVHNRQGWRRIYGAILHISGLLFSALWLYHLYYTIGKPFWRLSWMLEFFLLDRATAGWFTLLLIPLCVCVLWFGGMRLWTMPTEQRIISHRFDLGLAILLVLLVIKLVIVAKDAPIPMGPASTEFFLAFIILGLFSMGLVRTKSTSQENGVTYLKGAGIVLSFMSITLLLGGGLFILFLPSLQTVAEAGSELLGTMKVSIGRILIAFAFLSFRPGGFGNGRPELPAINRPGGDLEIIHYLFMGLGIVILLMMVFLLIPLLLTWFFSVFRWLFAKIEAQNDEQGIWKRLLFVIDSVRDLLSALWIKISYPPCPSSLAQKFFILLLSWGRFSGLKRTVSETPWEYGIRLAHRFPQVEKEIELIIQLHDEAVYGCMLPDHHRISRARRALRRIRKPFLWFARIKSFCFQDRF